MAGFMIQGGDPTGTGYGDHSIPNIQDEFTTTNHNYKRHNSNGKHRSILTRGSSQFFINVADNNNQLRNSLTQTYPVFRQSHFRQWTLLMAISNVATDTNDKPLQNVTINQRIQYIP